MSIETISAGSAKIYFAGLLNRRNGIDTNKPKIIPNALNQINYKTLPSFKQAENQAQQGDIYCWWCADNTQLEKKGSRHGKQKFQCYSCNSSITYDMPKQVYNNFKGVGFNHRIKMAKKKGKIKKY